jgi:hypothetical protein
MTRWTTETMNEWLECLQDVRQGNLRALIAFLPKHGVNRARSGELAVALQAYQPRWPTKTLMEWFERLDDVKLGDVKQGDFTKLIAFLRKNGLKPARARVGELADALEEYQANKNHKGRRPTRRPPLADLLGYPEAKAVAFYRYLRTQE